MSWDLFIHDFPATATCVADIPNDFEPPTLGSRADLIAKIRDVIPSVHFSDPGLGRFDGEAFSIECWMGDTEMCNGITFMIRGGGNPTPVVAVLLDRLQMRAIDCQLSEFFDVESARKSFASWQQYRDQVLRQSKGND